MKNNDVVGREKILVENGGNCRAFALRNVFRVVSLGLMVDRADDVKKDRSKNSLNPNPNI